MLKTKNINNDIVKKLLHYSEIMSNLYNQLYTLEINGKKDSKQYSELIELTYHMKTKEKAVYDSIPFQYLSNYMDYFMKIEEELGNANLCVGKALFTENSSYITIRITNQLNYMLEELYEYEEEEELEKFMDEEDSLSPSEYSSLFPQDASLLNDMEIDSFHEHILDASIIFLDELIENLNDIKLKDFLKKNKYINAF